MKLTITLLFICCMINADASFAFAISKPNKNKPGIAKISNNMKAGEFVKLTAKDVGLITAKRMNIWNRLSFFYFKNENKA